MLIIYTGNQKRYSLQKPLSYSFIKNVPIEIPDHIANELDANIFEKYNDKKDYGIIPEAKILVSLPHELKDFLCSLNIINRIKENYPKCNIAVYTNPGYKALLPPNIEVIDGVNLNTINSEYYKHYKLSRAGKKHVFNISNQNFHSLEKLYLMSSGLYNPIEDNELTVTINKPIDHNPTHIMLIKRGLTIGGTWEELANRLEKRFNEDDIRLHVINGYDPLRVKEYYDKFRETGYCISCGDSPLNWLCLYMGIPLFTFLPETIKELDIKQYDYFDNFMYSHIGITDDMESVYLTLKKNIGSIYGKDQEKTERQEPIKPIQTGAWNREPGERNDIDRVKETDSPNTVGRRSNNGYRRKRKRAVTAGN